MSNKPTTSIQPSMPVEPKRFNQSTFYLSVVLTFFVTMVITAVTSYFMTIGMIGSQREQIVRDMTVLSASQAPSKE